MSDRLTERCPYCSWPIAPQPCAGCAALREALEAVYGALCDLQCAPDCWCPSVETMPHTMACLNAQRAERSARSLAQSQPDVEKP